MPLEFRSVGLLKFTDKISRNTVISKCDAATTEGKRKPTRKGNRAGMLREYADALFTIPTFVA